MSPDAILRVASSAIDSGVAAGAIFFVTGQAVDRDPGVAREIVAAVHEVGIHGYHHGDSIGVVSHDCDAARRLGSNRRREPACRRGRRGAAAPLPGLAGGNTTSHQHARA